MVMMTNGHAWAGYKNAATYVPRYPLVHGRNQQGQREVRDSAGYWIATFRNDEDADRYVADGAERAKKMEAARKQAHENSKVDTGDEDKTLCRVCLRYFDSYGIGQHTRAKHGMRLGQMLKLRVPTEREYRELRNPKVIGSAQ